MTLSGYSHSQPRTRLRLTPSASMTLYDAYPLPLPERPQSFDSTSSKQPHINEEMGNNERVRDVFERQLIGRSSSVGNPGRRPGNYGRSSSMCSRYGKFHGEIYETKERSRVANMIRRRCRTRAFHYRSRVNDNGISILSKFTTNDVLRSGMLTKQGSWRRNWKMRFCILRRDYPSFCYYKSEEKLELLGAIIITGDSIVSDKCIRDEAPYRFQLRSNDMSLLVEAESRDNQLRWIDACQQLIDTLRRQPFQKSPIEIDRSSTIISLPEYSNQNEEFPIETPSRHRQKAKSHPMMTPSMDLGDMERLLDTSSGHSSDEEDGETEVEDNQHEEEEDDGWSSRESDYFLHCQSRQSMTPNQLSPHGIAEISTMSYDITIQLIVGRSSKLIRNDEKGSCFVHMLGYHHSTRQTVEIGRTDAIQLRSLITQATTTSEYADDYISVPFSVVLTANLVQFEQLRFTLYRVGPSSKRTVIGIGRCQMNLESCVSKTIALIEKSSSYPRGSKSNQVSPSNGLQLSFRAFPSLSPQQILPTTGMDMAAAKYLLSTSLEISPELDSMNQRMWGRYSTLAIQERESMGSYANINTRRMFAVDEILRVPRSTFALPIAFLEYLEARTLEKTQKVQEVEEEGLRSMVLEYYQQKREEYMHQKQFLMKQNSRLNDSQLTEQVVLQANQHVRQSTKERKRKKKASLDIIAIAPFKRSTLKGVDLWQFVPTNMQNQFLCAATFRWHTMTMGVPAAHTKGFTHGGYPMDLLPEQVELNGETKEQTGDLPSVEDPMNHLKQQLELQDRLDIISSQILSAAIACVIASLDLAVVGSQYHQVQLINAVKCGYLIHFESLLSTQGKELGMLEDFAQGTQWLRNVFIQFRLEMNGTTGESFTIQSYLPSESTCKEDETYLLVTMGVQLSHYQILPLPLQQGQVVRFHSVLFTQGVNEKQSLVHALKSTTVRIQERINRDNLQVLSSFYSIFRRIHGHEKDCVSRDQISHSTTNTTSPYSIETLDDLLLQLHDHIHSSCHQYKKNVALLMDSSDFCRALGGARVTCCKSGKDRTAMSITLEQTRLCCTQLHTINGKQMCTNMRRMGVRRHNVFMNTKAITFAFNEMQRKLLPDCYKPPIGTYRSGTT